MSQLDICLTILNRIVALRTAKEVTEDEKALENKGLREVCGDCFEKVVVPDVAASHMNFASVFLVSSASVAAEAKKGTGASGRWPVTDVEKVAALIAV